VYIKLGRVRLYIIMGICAYEKTILRLQVLQVHLELRAAPFRGIYRITVSPNTAYKLRLLRTKYSIIVQLLGAYKI